MKVSAKFFFVKPFNNRPEHEELLRFHKRPMRDEGICFAHYPQLLSFFFLFHSRSPRQLTISLNDKLSMSRGVGRSIHYCYAYERSRG